MALYECVFIARQDISAPQVDGLADTFAGIIEANGGKVTKRESWGLRKLAFRIKKNRKGHYVLFNIDAPAPAVHELGRQLGLHEDVLRHMTVRVEGLEEGPSAIMLARNSRDERPRRGDGFRGGDGGFRGGDGGFRESRGFRGRDDAYSDDDAPVGEVS